MYAPLLNENRSGIFDLVRYGYLCIVDEHSNVLYHAGDPEDFVFYRSASKPIQSLPVFKYGLDKKYGLTEEESTVLSGSHTGMPVHVAAVDDILRKADFSEDLLVIKPTHPSDEPANEARVRAGLPLRKVYHNCSGKHCALLMIQRELGGDPADYWKVGGPVHREVESTIKTMSEADAVKIGVDGCGVPVFAVPLKSIAVAFKNLACLDTIRDDALRTAAAENNRRIARYPHMIRGDGYLCTFMNQDPNIIAKGGANGVYAIGLKKQRLGIALKFVDGTEGAWPFLIWEILESLGALSDETRTRLETLHPKYFLNDNDVVVGARESLLHICI